MELLPGSAWLDGDDVWRANPFRVDEATKVMVLENISFVLANFLKAGYRHAILSWVLHQQEIIDAVLSGVDCRFGGGYALHVFTLTAPTGTLRARWSAGGRGAVSSLALDRLEQSRGLATCQVETDGRTPRDIAAALAAKVTARA